MLKIKVLHIIFLILALATIFLNYKRYKSYEVQAIINFDINEQDFTKRDMYFISRIDDNYPSVNVFAMPLKALKGQYLMEMDSIDLGIDYIEKSIDDNPYLMFSEGLLAKYYYNKGDLPKFKYYTRKIIKNMPNNPIHFVYYARLMKMENKIDSIFHHFNKIKKIVGNRDEQIWTITLSSVVLDSNLIEKYDAKDIAREAAAIFPNYPRLILMTDYIIYGKENIDLADKFHKDAVDYYQDGEINKSLNLFRNAIELHPNKLLYHTNYIKASFLEKRYNTIKNLFDHMSKTFKNISAETLYYIGYSMYQEDKTEVACNILKSLDSQKLIKFNKADVKNCFN